MPVIIYPTNLKYKNSNGQFQSATAIKGDSGEGIVVQVSGTTPTIICEDNHRYICGEVLSSNITPPANGVCEIIFESGSTATLLTAPNTIKWPEWFNPNSLETSATYQFKISNGLANVAIWPDEGLTGDTRVRIQKMLGIYEAPWELINEQTFTHETEATYTINTDMNGQPFELTDLIIQFEVPIYEEAASFGGSGQIAFKGSYKTTTIECGGFTKAANTSTRGCAGYIKQNKGMLEIYRIGSATNSNTGTIGMRFGTNFTESDRTSFQLLSTPAIFRSIDIRLVTGTGHYRLYGKRKWQ